MGSGGGGGVVESVSTASISYQPPPPVITEQPRSSIGPQHFQPFDRAYPKTLESLAEKVHTFYTGPRAPRQHGGGAGNGNRVRMPRTGSDHRLGSRSGEQQLWYGSMPRQRPGQQELLFGRGPASGTGGTGGGQGGTGIPPSARYSAGLEKVYSTLLYLYIACL